MHSTKLWKAFGRDADYYYCYYFVDEKNPEQEESRRRHSIDRITGKMERSLAIGSSVAVVVVEDEDDVACLAGSRQELARMGSRK